MLEFWFDPHTSIAQKLSILILAIIIAVALYLYAPMPTALILFFLGAGVIFLICRLCKIYLVKNDPRLWLYRVFTWIPLAFLCAIIFVKAFDHLLTWGVQGIAIMVVSICVFSPHVLLKKSPI
ncbi:hypothetical protein [Acinetobacter rathckeae]|uniref:hypothetical protein n=1 Tax=Acinetobacter rathckeae TaxID=2605272 RepID=UPI0018A2A118|nr:hypothetical protein [Acinetobacter rathckeae]MBF7688881.1 hypothetical protein [Acinetobacter rathckeae]MBF7696402.1 hypothetical protein [Acinetobacter rathckeae]